MATLHLHEHPSLPVYSTAAEEIRAAPGRSLSFHWRGEGYADDLADVIDALKLVSQEGGMLGAA